LSKLKSRVFWDLMAALDHLCIAKLHSQTEALTKEEAEMLEQVTVDLAALMKSLREGNHDAPLNEADEPLVMDFGVAWKAPIEQKKTDGLLSNDEKDV
jgi:hypothetical protein